jgi:hypothetical protein
MAIAPPKTNKFLNSREWRTFLSTAQSAATCPSVMRAVKAGQAWLSGRACLSETAWLGERALLGENAAKTSGWLLGDGSLATVPNKTLGV